MIPYLIGAAAGGALALKMRGAPKTKMKSVQCFGPRTGNVYTADIVADLGFVILHAADGTHCMFQKSPDGRFRYLKGEGFQATADAMKKDLEP